jgi:hypothetical protein
MYKESSLGVTGGGTLIVLEDDVSSFCEFLSTDGSNIMLSTELSEAARRGVSSVATEAMDRVSLMVLRLAEREGRGGGGGEATRLGR